MIIVNNKEKLEWHEGMTVQDVLDNMGFVYRRITVSVNNQLVPKEDYETHKVPDNADVNVFHLAHGG
ncbi:MAG: sulfur carrier protein ThiS [Bacillota bacterium]